MSNTFIWIYIIAISILLGCWIIPEIKSYLLNKKLEKIEKPIKEEVKRKVNILFKKLKLKPIPIKFLRLYDNCSFRQYELVFGINYLNRKSELKNQIIAHEVGHYFQYDKYNHWFQIFDKEYKKFKKDENFRLEMFKNNKDYKDLKLESNADKIAKITKKWIENK